jgi:hypothetical protein
MCVFGGMRSLAFVALVLFATLGAESRAARAETPLELATGTAAPTAAPAPAAAEPEVRTTPSEPGVAGVWTMAGLAPILTVAHVGAQSFVWGGAALLSMSGDAWFLPAGPGFTARVGGRLALVEAMPVGIYTTELSGALGYSVDLFGGHRLAFVGGAEGSGGYASKHQFAILRIPEVEAAWQWQTRGAFVEVGGLGGLSVIGRYAIGEAIVSSTAERDYSGVSHTLKPYAGGRVAVVATPMAASIAARRTFVGAARPGGSLDHALANLCFAFLSRRGSPGLGACLLGDLFRGQVARVEPAPGPVQDAWSYRLTLNVGASQVLLP